MADYSWWSYNSLREILTAKLGVARKGLDKDEQRNNQLSDKNWSRQDDSSIMTEVNSKSTDYTFYTAPLFLWSFSIQVLVSLPPFNNMQSSTHKMRFRYVNQIFGDSSQLPTSDERTVTIIKANRSAQCNIVGSWEEPPNIWLAVAKNASVGLSFEF